MTLPDPRTLPDSGFVSCRFALHEQVSLSRYAGGRAVARVQYGDPWIHASIETLPQYPSQRARWEAWLASLRGGMKSFITHDLSRPELIAYPNGVPEIVAGTWNGQGTIDSLAARLITAAGAPSGFTMSAGDLIGLVEDGRRWVGFVTETVTRGASTIAVPVDPAVPLGIFSSAATVVFYRPQAEFIILSDTWQQSNVAGPTSISFQAVQKI